jgi:hypothetical protein
MRTHVAASLALALGLVSPWTLAIPGEYWEITNKMEMQGMQMPGITNKVCLAKGGERDPRNSADKDCEMTDMKASGNKSSWKMRCNKDGDVMAGSGEMATFTDRTEGTFRFESAKSGGMTMGFINKRVGGACDTDEMKKKFDAQLGAINKNAEQEMAKACEPVRRKLGRDVGAYFTMKDPQSPMPKTCGLDMAVAKKTLCKSVDINNADFVSQVPGDGHSAYTSNLQSECPREMKTYMEASRKRLCEGRSFTGKPKVSMADCLKGAGDMEAGMDQADPQEAELPKTKGKKAAAQVQPQTDTSRAEAATEGPTSGGIAIPGLPGTSVSPDAIIDGAKKLKSLFGF